MHRIALTGSAVRSAAVAVAAITIGGCAQTSEAVRTVTVHETAQAAPAASASSRPAHGTKPKAAIVRRSRASAFSQCDANISVKASTTTCGFAQNAFYEYWTSGQASDIQVYSPATKQVFATHCTVTAGIVRCTTHDRGAVRFSVAAIDRYDQDQADAYAASHDLGSGPPYSGDNAPSAPPSDGAGDPSSDPYFCDTHDCIPNYPNGNGYTVQCADGSYSQSGGIQGACSHHGGVN